MGFLVRILNRYIYNRFGRRVGRIVSGSITGGFGLLILLAGLAVGAGSSVLIGFVFLALGVGFLIWGLNTPKEGPVGGFGISNTPQPYGQPQYPVQQPYGQPQYPAQQPYGQPQYPSQPGQPYGQPQYPEQQPYGQPQYPAQQPYGQPQYPAQPGQPQYPSQPGQQQYPPQQYPPSSY